MLLSPFSAVSLPVELVNFLSLALVALVTYLVVEGFKTLERVFHKDFSAAAKMVAAALSSAVVSAVLGILNGVLALIPPAYEPLVQGILAVLVVIVGMFTAMGIHRQLRLRQDGFYPKGSG